MDGLFTWIIIAGAIFSFIRKVAENNIKTTKSENQIRDNVDYVSAVRKFVTKAQLDALIPSSLSTEIPLKKPILAKVGLPAEGEGTSDYEGTSFGDGTNEYEGTSFGDATKGTEGESAEELERLIIQQEAFSIPVEEDTKWNLNSENLMSAIVFAEILGPPRSRQKRFQ